MDFNIQGCCMFGTEMVCLLCDGFHEIICVSVGVDSCHYAYALHKEHVIRYVDNRNQLLVENSCGHLLHPSFYEQEPHTGSLDKYKAGHNTVPGR